MGVLWENDLVPFLFITVILGGGAALLSGRAIARNWRPFWQLVLFMALLTGAVRFFHYALFGGTLLSVHHFLVEGAILLLLAGTGYRLTRVRQMVTQYRWLYERRALLFWRRREG